MGPGSLPGRHGGGRRCLPPGAGPALVVSFVLTAIACGFTALCYAEFASLAPVSGSAYTNAYATWARSSPGSSAGTSCLNMPWATSPWPPPGRATSASCSGASGWSSRDWLATDLRTGAEYPGDPQFRPAGLGHPHRLQPASRVHRHGHHRAAGAWASRKAYGSTPSWSASSCWCLRSATSKSPGCVTSTTIIVGPRGPEKYVVRYCAM